MTRDAQNRFFISVFEKKNLDSVWNEFGSVQKNTVRFGYYNYLLLK